MNVYGNAWNSPVASKPLPPKTEANLPDAVFSPLTDAPTALAVLLTPPLTVACTTVAMFSAPPLTDDSAAIALFSPPPLTDAASPSAEF